MAAKILAIIVLLIGTAARPDHSRSPLPEEAEQRMVEERNAIIRVDFDPFERQSL